MKVQNQYESSKYCHVQCKYHKCWYNVRVQENHWRNGLGIAYYYVQSWETSVWMLGMIDDKFQKQNYGYRI